MAFNGRLIFHAIGNWSQRQVVTEAVGDGRLRLPEVESLIDEQWQRAINDSGTKNLFDGPICRLERWLATPERLRLSLSLTSYKVFLGTHLAGDSVYRQFGPLVMAIPLGVSCALETIDGWLLLGRRNNSVAYYPNRIHPFAGSMDPRGNPAPNVFEEIHRELLEEIGLQLPEIVETRCVGLAEDITLHHPELIFTVRTSQTRADVEAGLDVGEHSSVHAVAGNQDNVEQTLNDPDLTPIAVATVALWGRQAFGECWFDLRWASTK